MTTAKRTAMASAIATALICLSLPANAEMNVEERLKALEARMNSLAKENQALKNQLQKAEQKVEATGDQLDKLSSAGTTTQTSWADKTRLGGYGELHLNKLGNNKLGGASKDEMDLHRFVLFLGHQFNDTLSFHSELEVEHAFAGSTAPGEVELEQAYLDFKLGDSMSAKAGMFLVPVGITNETHEPPTFYGVERNPVESNIIPATWWEGGGRLSARLGKGFSVDAAVTTGLKTAAASNYAVRSGRTKAAKATAKDAAYTARLKWTGIPGLELAGTVQYQSDITQSTDTTAGDAKLYEAHAVLNKGAFGLRALYAKWNLSGSGPKSRGADQQKGWYIEPSFKLNDQWGVFARYSRWDNRAGDATDSRNTQSDIGVSYWPHRDVVLKLDYQKQQTPTGSDEFDGINLGVGYQF